MPTTFEVAAERQFAVREPTTTLTSSKYETAAKFDSWTRTEAMWSELETGSTIHRVQGVVVAEGPRKMTDTKKILNYGITASLFWGANRRLEKGILRVVLA